jgi:hypothetical protein
MLEHTELVVLRNAYKWDTLSHIEFVHSIITKFLKSILILFSPKRLQGTPWYSCLRYCSTSRKVKGSNLNVIIQNFYRHNPSGRTMTLGLTQPLTKMSTRNISWVLKAAGA